jgi:DNA-binding NarL/FixJ family response regulator
MTITELETLPEIRGWQLISPGNKTAPLSPRELITAGRTPKEVAFDLGLSDATVRVLYSRAMKKLGRRRSRRPAESRV